jgi:primosomal protein N' (replication factor Y) (superfamily II helicase)
VVCFECGWVGKCPDCEIGWTYHKRGDRMICHYCGREQKGPLVCTQCGSHRLSFRSAGTQRLEETLLKILPKATTIRLDTDVASKKWESRDILDDFGKGKYQILLGTQMVAKGHHFPRVGLVGIISSDIGLSLPDFRATERVLQLLTQAAGRAGRSSKRGDPGLVMIQTFSPENPIFAYLKANDFIGFLEDELKIRHALGYPPYKRLVLIVVSALRQLAAMEGVGSLKAELESNMADKEIDILGPVESPVFKLGKLFRYQLLLKLPLELEPKELLGGLDDFSKRFRGLFVKIDVDPVSFM